MRTEELFPGCEILTGFRVKTVGRDPITRREDVVISLVDILAVEILCECLSEYVGFVVGSEPAAQEWINSGEKLWRPKLALISI